MTEHVDPQAVWKRIRVKASSAPQATDSLIGFLKPARRRSRFLARTAEGFDLHAAVGFAPGNLGHHPSSCDSQQVKKQPSVGQAVDAPNTRQTDDSWRLFGDVSHGLNGQHFSPPDRVDHHVLVDGVGYSAMKGNAGEKHAALQREKRNLLGDGHITCFFHGTRNDSPFRITHECCPSAYFVL